MTIERKPGNLARDIVHMLPKVQPRPRKAKQAKRARYTGASKEVLDLVRARCKGRCERCSRLLTGIHGGDPHHRTARGMGGSRDPRLNRASGIVALCRPCHDWIESQRTLAKVDGWLVPRNEDLLTTPVRSWFHGGRVLLTDDGRAVPAPIEGGAA